MTESRNPMPPQRARPKEHIEYHKDGSVWAKGQTADGVPVGYWEWFRLSGTRMRSGHFERGEPAGEWITYDKAGQVYKVTRIKPKAAKDPGQGVATKPPTGKSPGGPGQAAGDADDIARYGVRQIAAHAAICSALRAAMDAGLPKAASKIWHGSPVWFIGENPVAGYHVTSKRGVNLLFWNGQAFGESALKAAGRFRAAQIQFNEVSEIDPKALRRWLRKARTEIWDYRGYFLTQKALQKKAKP